MNTTTFTFDQLNSALLSCTPCHLTLETDEDGDRAYALRDGCGDQMGDLFDDLYDVHDYISNNSDVASYLADPN